MTALLPRGWRFRIAAAYAAAAVLLYFFLRHTDWATLGDGVRAAAWPLLAAAVVLRLASLLVAALRWQVLLESAGPVPLGGVIAATMMGMTASAVVPMPAAEIVRPFVLSRQQRIDFTSACASAVAEWLFDAVAILVWFIPATLWLRAGRSGTPSLLATEAALLLLGCAGVAALRLLPRRMASLARGLGPLDRSRSVGRAAAYSMLLAALVAASAWLTLTAFHLQLPPAAGFFLLGLVTVAGMVPTPGAVGGFHAVCQLALVEILGLDRARTVLPVIALHGVLYLPGAALGVLCFLWWQRRLRRSDV